jgi:hypothetical protein
MTITTMLIRMVAYVNRGDTIMRICAVVRGDVGVSVTM